MVMVGVCEWAGDIWKHFICLQGAAEHGGCIIAFYNLDWSIVWTESMQGLRATRKATIASSSSKHQQSKDGAGMAGNRDPTTELWRMLPHVECIERMCWRWWGISNKKQILKQGPTHSSFRDEATQSDGAGHSGALRVFVIGHPQFINFDQNLSSNLLHTGSIHHLTFLLFHPHKLGLIAALA
ncbi:hypothetical protein GOP47_0030863 [Adiantum capillus-veneris]|nr:hypothetical protein GOP47_0030863 [Adiantum capillus-veneris]